MSIKDLYSKKVMEHFQNPHHMGTLKNPSGVGRVGNPICGDLMELQIRVKADKAGRAEKAIIEDAKFQTFGCGAAIATSSMMTDLIIGKTLKEAKKISNKAVTEALGGLPPIKRHCSVLAEEALAKAIADFESKKMV